MAAALVVLFLVVPLAELYLVIQVGQVLGALNTIALLVIIGAMGGWLMKREGLGVLRRIQAQVHRGQVPGRELVDAFLILFGGALMLTPGFLTDVLGFGLLVPPVRAVVRRSLARQLQVRALGGGTGRRRRPPDL